jgi:hypothetical protein
MLPLTACREPSVDLEMEEKVAYESEEEVPEAAKAVPETNHVAPVSSVEDGERPPTAPNSPVLPESTTGKKKEEEKAQEEGQIEVKGEKEVGAKRKEPEEAEGPQKDGQQKRARTGSPSGTLTFSRRLSQFERERERDRWRRRPDFCVTVVQVAPGASLALVTLSFAASPLKVLFFPLKRTHTYREARERERVYEGCD